MTRFSPRTFSSRSWSTRTARRRYAETTVGARRGLDHVGDDVRLPLLVEVGQRLAAPLCVLLQVVVGAVGDPLELAPADGEVILDVGGPLGVVGELVLLVFAQPQILGPQAVAAIPGQAVLDPALVPRLVGRPAADRVVGVDEVLDLHLLELAGPEKEVAGGDLVPEA